MPRLTKSVVDAAKPKASQYTVWCSDLKGFGVFIMPSGTRTYFVDYRNTHNRRRRMTIGRHGTITAEEARKLAIVTLGKVTTGEDPAEDRAVQRRKTMTVKELCDAYLEAADKGLIMGKSNRPKKESTLSTDRGHITNHIIPLLGSKRVSDLTKPDINRFVREVVAGRTVRTARTQKPRGKSIVKGGPGAASRSAGLLGGILAFAVSEGIIDVSPSIGVKRPADKIRTRRLSPSEYRSLGKALEEAKAEGELHQLIDCIWLLALSGCRSGEITNLKWDEVQSNEGCLRLLDSKEGSSVRPAGRALLDHIKAIEREEDWPYVLTPARTGQIFGGLPGGWMRIKKRAGFTDVSPHTLRHSFASTAGDLGYSELTIAAMLGHSAATVTSRYIHHLDAVLIAAADKVAARIYQMMTSD